MTTLALADSASLALSAGTATVSAAAGVLALLGGWFAHHELAHRHPRWDLLAKLLIAAGATILFASAEGGLVQRANLWTVPLLTSGLRHIQPGATWPANFGILTMVEVVLLLWMAVHLWDAVRAKRGGASAGGGGGSGRSRGRSWAWLRHQFEKYGYFAAGPLSVTVPGTIGAVVAAPFALLAGFVGHLIGAPFGLG
jgi:hypothetical protein